MEPCADLGNLGFDIRIIDTLFGGWAVDILFF